MIIVAVKIKLYAPWIQTLKEKRMVTKSIIAKTRNKFNVSISEIDDQDRHKTIILGIALVADSIARSDTIIDKLVKFIENNHQAEIQEIIREFR